MQVTKQTGKALGERPPSNDKEFKQFLLPDVVCGLLFGFDIWKVKGQSLSGTLNVTKTQSSGAPSSTLSYFSFQI